MRRRFSDTDVDEVEVDEVEVDAAEWMRWKRRLIRLLMMISFALTLTRASEYHH